MEKEATKEELNDFRNKSLILCNSLHRKLIAIDGLIQKLHNRNNREIEIPLEELKVHHSQNF
jgi:hypothetical protein